MDNEKYYGNYLGYVVANNSPTKDGTVQVFVPDVNARIIERWVKDEDSLYFRMQGVNIDSLLTPEITQYLRESLPWARIAQPIIGSGSSGYVNQSLSTVADGSSEQNRRIANPELLVEDDEELEQQGENGSIGESGIPANSAGADSFVPKYPITAYHESGIYRRKGDPYAVGAVSSGKGDFGGKSYGVYQFPSSDPSHLKSFINWKGNPFGERLKKFPIGSSGFDAEWKSLGLDSNKKFGQAQETYHRNFEWNKQLSGFSSKSGVDFTGRSESLVDVVVGSVNQYGSLTTGQANYINSKGGNSLSDREIGVHLQNYKLANYQNNFRSSSPRVREAVKNRIIRERNIFENLPAGGDSGGGENDAPQEGEINEAKASSEEDLINPDNQFASDKSDHIGSKPAVQYEDEHDAFDETGDHRNNINANPHSHNVCHDNYSNMAKGSVSLPQPGSHVWVFFTAGDPDLPVVFGYNYGEQDIRDLYSANSESPDYPPASKDNFHTGTEQNKESETFRSKWVVNERGGSFDIVSTTSRERIKMTHFSGSNLEFNQFGSNLFTVGNSQKTTDGNDFQTIRGHTNRHVDGDQDDIILGNRFEKTGNIKEWTPLVEQIVEKLKPIHEKKRTFELKRAEHEDELDNSPLQSKSGTPAECPVCTKEHNRVNDNSYEAVLPDECLSCDGTGESPSSQDGDWDEEDAKEEVTDDIKSVTPELAELEKELANLNFSDGGSKISIVANDRVDTIGLVFNDLEAYRKDAKGKFVPHGLNLDEKGVFPDYAATPLVESVHVDPIPGGDWNVVAGNKVTVVAGSNGMQLKTAGRLDTFGSIANFAGEQVNISAKSELILDGGKRLDLQGDTISIRPRINKRDSGESQSVVVDANLNVAKNMVIAGTTHIEGELSVNHITAPVEEQYADMIGGVEIGIVYIGTAALPVYSIPAQNAVKVYNIPIYLPESQSDVRARTKDKVKELHPSPADKVSSIRRVAEQESEQFETGDDPYINEHGDGAEETLDSGKNFEEAIA